MDNKGTLRMLHEYINDEAAQTIGEGWELDPLVFWNEVADAQETTGMDMIDAYDEVVSHSSYLLPSHAVIKKYKKIMMFFKEKKQVLNEYILEEYIVAVEKNLQEKCQSFDVLLFWQQVDFLRQDHGSTTIKAYDLFIKDFSVALLPSSTVLKIYKKDTSFRSVLSF